MLPYHTSIPDVAVPLQLAPVPWPLPDELGIKDPSSQA